MVMVLCFFMNNRLKLDFRDSREEPSGKKQ